MLKLKHLIPPAAILAAGISWTASQRHAITALRNETAALGQWSEQPPIPDPTPTEPPPPTLDTLPAPRVGPLDWTSILSQLGSSTGDVSVLWTRLAAMSPAELLTAIDEIAALDFPKHQKDEASRWVVEHLAKKDPEAALTRLVDRLDDYSCGFTSNLDDAFVKWLTEDSAAATAWFDAQIAAGNFDARGIDGVSRPRAEYEGMLISKLLLVDPAGARRRLSVVPDNTQFTTMQSVWTTNMQPAELQSYADLARSGQPVLEPGLVIGQFMTRVLISKTYPESAAMLDQMGATDVERAAVLEQNPLGNIENIRDRKPQREDFDDLREWFTAVAPNENLDKLTGRALANERNGRTFDEAAQLALDYGGSEVLAEFLESKNPGDHPAEVRKLAEHIEDPERRAHILRRLEPNTIGR